MTLPAPARPHLTVVPTTSTVAIADEYPDQGYLTEEKRRELRNVVAKIREIYDLTPDQLWVRISLNTTTGIADTLALRAHADTRLFGEHCTMAVLDEECPDDLHPELTDFEVAVFGDDRWPAKPLRIGGAR